MAIFNSYVQLPEGIASTSFRLQYPVDHPVRNSNVQPNLVWSGRRCWLHLDSIWFFQVCAEFHKVVLCSNRNPKNMDVILFMRCHNNHEISPGMGNLTPMIAKQLQWTGWLDYRWSVRPRIHSFKKKQWPPKFAVWGSFQELFGKSTELYIYNYYYIYIHIWWWNFCCPSHLS